MVVSQMLPIQCKFWSPVLEDARETLHSTHRCSDIQRSHDAPSESRRERSVRFCRDTNPNFSFLIFPFLVIWVKNRSFDVIRIHSHWLEHQVEGWQGQICGRSFEWHETDFRTEWSKWRTRLVFSLISSGLCFSLAWLNPHLAAPKSPAECNPQWTRRRGFLDIENSLMRSKY